MHRRKRAAGRPFYVRVWGAGNLVSRDDGKKNHPPPQSLRIVRSSTVCRSHGTVGSAIADEQRSVITDAHES